MKITRKQIKQALLSQGLSKEANIVYAVLPEEIEVEEESPRYKSWWDSEKEHNSKDCEGCKYEHDPDKFYNLQREEPETGLPENIPGLFRKGSLDDQLIGRINKLIRWAREHKKKCNH